MAELDYDYIAQLVVQAQKGSSDAFAELYTATYRRQYQFACKYVKDVFLAQDILQETYILVLKNLTKLKNPRLFVSWINQITFHVCFDYNEKYKIQSNELNNEAIDLDSKPLFHGTNPEQLFEDLSSKQEMMDKILYLPPNESQAIIMKYYNDMKLEDISMAMDVSRSSVKRYIASGLKTLKRQMKHIAEGGDLNGRTIKTFK